MTKPKLVTFTLVALSSFLSVLHWEALGRYVQLDHDGNQRRSVSVADLNHNRNESNATVSSVATVTLRNASVFNDTNKTASSEPMTKRMDVQLAITGSIKLHANAMRLLTTSINGWHQDFEDVQIYTFDPVHENSPFRGVITPVEKLFPKEKTKRNNNLLLAAIKEVYNHNPNAEWYFLAEDDSIVIKENLLQAIKEHKLNSSEYIMAGKSVLYQPTKGDNIPMRDNKLPFVVGGSGILLSHALTKALAPLIPTCREKYNKLFYGDARVGACVQVELNVTDVQPLLMANLFTNGNSMTTIATRYKNPQTRNDRLISLHEKDPARIELLQTWIFNQRARNRTITWKSMRDSRLHIRLNKTKAEQ